jgi:hypothetical protein
MLTLCFWAAYAVTEADLRRKKENKPLSGILFLRNGSRAPGVALSDVTPEESGSLAWSCISRCHLAINHDRVGSVPGQQGLNASIAALEKLRRTVLQSPHRPHAQ